MISTKALLGGRIQSYFHSLNWFMIILFCIKPFFGLSTRQHLRVFNSPQVWVLWIILPITGTLPLWYNNYSHRSWTIPNDDSCCSGDDPWYSGSMTVCMTIKTLGTVSERLTFWSHHLYNCTIYLNRWSDLVVQYIWINGVT